MAEENIHEILENLRFDIEEMEELLDEAKQFADKIESMYESA
jgi:uncharacterized membrane protein (DUF106 family)